MEQTRPNKRQISAFAKQYAIPVSLARQAWEEGGNTYMGAFSWLSGYLKAVCK